MRKRVSKFPFFYGWFLLGCVCLVGIARQGPAVATTSLFVAPMSEEFGWSRAVFSGAVSLGGILAAFASPLLGLIMDRFGARVILIFAVTLTSFSCLSLSTINSLLPFYIFFCIARMNFAGPFDLGIYGVINNWFVQRRPLATAIANVAQAAGLACMPLIASFAILGGNWRDGWLGIGVMVLIFGLIPACFLKFRQPEDIGLFPDGRDYGPLSAGQDIETNIIAKEPEFSRKEALRCPAFWMLSLFTLMVFPVQAGVSLHQAPHLLERGLTGMEAAATISLFPLCGAAMTMLTGLVARKISARILLAVAGAILALSTVFMLHITI